MNRGAWWATAHKVAESDTTEATQHAQQSSMGVLLNNIVTINLYFAPSLVEMIMLIKNRNSNAYLTLPEVESKSKVMSGVKTVNLRSPW